MRPLGLLVVIVGLAFPVANAQEPDAPEGAPIASVEVSGFSVNQLSPGLRQAIDALVRGPLSQARVVELASRIEAEQPELVVAVRSVLRPDGEARVIFLVARISDDRDIASNINARYTVDSVEISGVEDSAVSQELRRHAGAGRRAPRSRRGRAAPRTARSRAARVHREATGSPGTPVGPRPRDLRRQRARDAPLDPLRAVEVEAWSITPRWVGAASWTSRWGGRDNRLTLGLVGDNDDDLIEEYSGYRVRLESRKVATERLGLSLEFAELRQSWRDATLSAAALNPQIAAVYRERRTIEPMVTVAFSPHVRVSYGASVTELESLFRSSGSQMASTANFSIGYDQRWELASGATEAVEASYELRAATTALESDLDYKRHLGRAQFRFSSGSNTVIASIALGRISGSAPLFERFSLGDSSTLRGWNKFDVAVAGGNRMAYHSLEYRHDSLAFFFDLGSVWDEGTDSRLRLATGVGFHGENAFVTMGFPLNADDLSAQFMAGVRF